MKRALYADDNNLFRQSLALVLKWYTDVKMRVESNSLTEARQVLGNSNHKPDHAVVDLDLAYGEGFELIEAWS